MRIRNLNWPIWAGFVLSVIAFLSYPLLFVWFPITRDFPWANLLLFALAAILLLLGVRRAFAPERTHPKRSKLAGAILATLSVAVFAFFVFSIFIVAGRLPQSQSAPGVGQKAPDFTLSDINGNNVSLSELLSSPINGENGNAGTRVPNEQNSVRPKGVLLMFYRGYW